MKDSFGFVKAVKLAGVPVKSFRIFAEAKDGSVGVTAWYPENKETEMALLNDIKKSGHKVIKIERSKIL